MVSEIRSNVSQKNSEQLARFEEEVATLSWVSCGGVVGARHAIEVSDMSR